MRLNETIEFNANRAELFFHWSPDVLTRAQRNLVFYHELVNELGTNHNYSCLWPGIQLREMIDSISGYGADTAVLSFYKKLYHKLTGHPYTHIT